MNAILTNTLYEKRWMVFFWSLSVLAMTVFIMVFFPTLRDSFGQSLQNVPDSMRALVGDAASYNTISGYIDLQVFDQMIFLTLIFGIILFTNLLAGEEGEGTLQTLLSKPVSRSRVYVQKLVSGSVLTAIVTSMFIVGGWLGAALINETVEIDRLALATLGAYLVTMLFCAIAYTIGAVTGKRGMAGMVAGILAFVSYLVSSLAQGIDNFWLDLADKLSPFHYYNSPSPLTAGVDYLDSLILIGASIVLLVVGYAVFVRRDIPQR